MNSLNTSLLNNEIKLDGRISGTSSTAKKGEALSSPFLGERKIAVVAPNQTIEATAATQASRSAPNFTAHKNSDAAPSMIEAPLSSSTTPEAKAHLRILKQLDAQEQANNLAMLTARSSVASSKGSYVPPIYRTS